MGVEHIGTFPAGERVRFGRKYSAFEHRAQAQTRSPPCQTRRGDDLP